MMTRPAGSSMYSVFCGSSGRQSAGVDAASTSAVVSGLLRRRLSRWRSRARAAPQVAAAYSRHRDRRASAGLQASSLHCRIVRHPTALMAWISSAPAFCASPYSMRVLSR